MQFPKTAHDYSDDDGNYDDDNDHTTTTRLVTDIHFQHHHASDTEWHTVEGRQLHVRHAVPLKRIHTLQVQPRRNISDRSESSQLFVEVKVDCSRCITVLFTCLILQTPRSPRFAVFTCRVAALLTSRTHTHVNATSQLASPLGTPGLGDSLFAITALHPWTG